MATLSHNHTTIDDAILAGIIDTFPECRVTPQQGGNGRTSYRIEGDYEGVLKKIYSNTLVGCLDVFKSIKTARQAIFTFRSKQEQEKGEDRNGKFQHKNSHVF